MCRLCANWPKGSETQPRSAKRVSHVGRYWATHKRTGPNSSEEPESDSGSGESWFEPRRAMKPGNDLGRAGLPPIWCVSQCVSCFADSRAAQRELDWAR